MTLDDSALAGAPKLATDYLVYLQWASRLTNLGDLGKKGREEGVISIKKMIKTI